LVTIETFYHAVNTPPKGFDLSAVGGSVDQFGIGHDGGGSLPSVDIGGSCVAADQGASVELWESYSISGRIGGFQDPPCAS
jgi:hypothetical protein